MSGISARPQASSAKRSRPSESGPRSAPPVLFRLPALPSLTQESDLPTPSHSPSATAAVATASHASMMSAALAVPSAAASPMTRTVMPEPIINPPGHGLTQTASHTADIAVSHASVGTSTSDNLSVTRSEPAAAAIAAEKAAGQKLLNIVIMLVLLAALVIITWISLQAPPAASDLASQGDNAALESLGSLTVPEVAHTTATPQPMASDAGQSVADSQSTSQPAELSLGSTPSLPAKPEPARAEPESLITGLDTNIQGPLAAASLSPASVSATSPKAAEPAAQIQLRPAVPVNNLAGSLVSAKPNPASPTEAGAAVTPRIDTVSTPSSVNSSVGPVPGASVPHTPGLDLSEPVVKPATEPEVGKPRTATSSGASPSLWDGAANLSNKNSSNGSAPAADSTPMPLITSGVTISDPLSANISMPGTSTSTSISSGTGASSSANAMAATMPAKSAEQAVTVGGGSREPYNLGATRTTATPESDSAATIQMYQSYAQQRQTSATQSTQSPAAVPAAQPINSYAIGAGTPIPAGQNQYVNGYVKSAPATNSYTAAGLVPNATPGGITAGPSGPYVPGNTPATAPSSQFPGQMVNSQMVNSQIVGGHASAPTTLPSYTQPSYTQPTGAPTYPVNAYGAGSGYGVGGSGYPNPGYPPPSFAPGTPNYSTPNYSPNGAAPRYPTPSAGGYAPQSSPMPSGMQGAATYPGTPNPYPGGQVPMGMMGPSGYATAPIGEFQPPRPVTGTMGYGVSVPNGIQ